MELRPHEVELIKKSFKNYSTNYLTNSYEYYCARVAQLRLIGGKHTVALQNNREFVAALQELLDERQIL